MRGLNILIFCDSGRYFKRIIGFIKTHYKYILSLKQNAIKNLIFSVRFPPPMYFCLDVSQHFPCYIHFLVCLHDDKIMHLLRFGFLSRPHLHVYAAVFWMTQWSLISGYKFQNTTLPTRRLRLYVLPNFDIHLPDYTVSHYESHRCEDPRVLHINPNLSFLIYSNSRNKNS